MPQPSTKPFSGIFVSYRRDDSSGHAGRLFDRLSTRFGEDQVFMDIDHIEPGEKFDRVIENAVGSCEILIAIIGRHWLSSTDGSSRRLDNPKDFVRLEIVAALNRDIRVIPVLVQGATMPKAQDLPDDLAELSSRHAHELSDLRWQRDVDQLIVAMERVLAQREARRRAADEEAQRQFRETEEEARRLSEEARQAEEERQNKLAEQELRAEGDPQSQPTLQPASGRAMPGRRKAESALTEVDETGLESRSSRSAKRTHQRIYIALAAAASLMVLVAGLFMYHRAKQTAFEVPERVPVDQLKSGPTPSEPAAEIVPNANPSPSIPATSPSKTPTRTPPSGASKREVAKELDKILHPKQQ